MLLRIVSAALLAFAFFPSHAADVAVPQPRAGGMPPTIGIKDRSGQVVGLAGLQG